MGLSTSVYPVQKILFIVVLNLLSTCPSTLNIEESLREEAVFALSILETMDSNSWKSVVASFGWERGAGNGDSCSPWRVEAPGLCPQFALAGATPWETEASSLTQNCAEESPLSHISGGHRAAVLEQILSVSLGISHVTCS